MQSSLSISSDPTTVSSLSTIPFTVQSIHPSSAPAYVNSSISNVTSKHPSTVPSLYHTSNNGHNGNNGNNGNNGLNVSGTKNNTFDGLIPPTLQNITIPECFATGGNTLTGTMFSELRHITTSKCIAIGDQDTAKTLRSELEIAPLEYFPTQLGNLQLLTGLNLYESLRTSTIPIELSQLENTLSINLTRNGLTGNIPSKLASITTLTKIWLCNINLTESFPSEFAFLTTLLDIHFCNNELKGTMNDRRSRLLQILNLDTNVFSGGFTSKFGLHNDLHKIIIRENSVTETKPTDFANPQSLLSLSAVRNRLTGSVPSELKAILTLSSFNLENLLATSVPSKVQGIENLTFIHITANSIINDFWSMCDLNTFAVNARMTTKTTLLSCLKCVNQYQSNNHHRNDHQDIDDKQEEQEILMTPKLLQRSILHSISIVLTAFPTFLSPYSSTMSTPTHLPSSILRNKNQMITITETSDSDEVDSVQIMTEELQMSLATKITLRSSVLIVCGSIIKNHKSDSIPNKHEDMNLISSASLYILEDQLRPLHA